MPRIVTWNMQGATDGVEGAWTKGIQALLTQANADVVCLQEASALPSTAMPYSPPPPLPGWLGQAPPAGLVCTFAEWTPEHTPYYILWAQTDSLRNRINLALVCRLLPSGFWYVDSGLPGARPALGVRIAGANIFSLHAFTGSGDDAPQLLERIDAAVPGDEEWSAAGDYNREAPWQPPAGGLCPPNGPTFWPSNKRFDYMVRTLATTKGNILSDMLISDHYPVAFD